MSFLGFGARRRRSRKGGKGRKGGKPSATLVRMCKKYGVKVMRFGSRTTSFGSQRTKSYKKGSTLKKLCAKAIRRRIKQVKRQMKKTKKSSPRRARFGGVRKTLRGLGRKLYKYKYTLGTAAALGGGAMVARRPGMRVRMRRYARRAGLMRPASLEGGAHRAQLYRNMAVHRQKARDMSPAGRKRVAAAEAKRMGNMRAFVKGGRFQGALSRARDRIDKRDKMDKLGSLFDFGKRRRRYRFGNGGNPPLSQSMGYEFCSNGGGVLGANSTGLFPTPCTPQAPAAFGKRRRRRS
jgi:hypothetical protein